MGITCRVEFDREVPDFGALGGENLALGLGLRRLDKLAKDRGLVALSEYVSFDPDEIAEGSGENIQVTAQTPRESPLQWWFDPEAGLNSVRAVRKLLDDDPGADPKAGFLISELQQIAEELEAARKCGARFHFSLRD